MTMRTTSSTTNRLINEKSPYLLQHAHNPVDWYPWGPEAFDTAKAHNKPIFLSIGYATCHWCHVMERESFEDPDVARLLNDRYVSIKVDREERPDIDAVYMAVCHMLTGSGGWPLTIVMTPDQKPFFAGTYIPKTSGFGRYGLMELGQRLHFLWENQRQEVISASDGIVNAMDTVFDFETDPNPSNKILPHAYERLTRTFDSTYGGFDGAPKFPTPHRIRFLLRHYLRTGEEKALHMAKKTLFAMRLGGIWDHVGFGFHRYSTDDQWLVPHFEKMLYDQALIAMAYLETFETTEDPFFKRTAEEIFAYVNRDLALPGGGFCAAEDADSEGVEGKFYVWREDEFRQTLSDMNPDRWIKFLQISEMGNYREEGGRKPAGTNIPHLRNRMSVLSGEMDMEFETLKKEWAEVRKRLFEKRNNRVRPLLDDKVLCDWNGLMIAAFAMGSRILKNPEYALIAKNAVRFILNRMTDKSGRLFHRFRDKEAAIEGQAGDYAFFIMGLIELYRSTAAPEFLETAVSFQKRMTDEFWDSEKGGFYMTSHEAEPLPARPKELYDGAAPSANSAALSNLMWLYKLTGNAAYKKEAESIVTAFSGSVANQPMAHCHFLLGLDLLLQAETDTEETSTEEKEKRGIGANRTASK
jgi:uncharacterized protein